MSGPHSPQHTFLFDVYWDFVEPQLGIRRFLTVYQAFL